MLYGIVDVGSNTIRLGVYDCEGPAFRVLLAKKETAGLAGYVRKGNLSAQGIDRCIQVLRAYQAAVEPFRLDGFFVFATASLRNVRNTDEAVRRIWEETGLRVDVIPGRDEAVLDFAGAVYGTGMESGLMVDIGGGSIELAAFSHGRLEQAVSVDTGSLKLYTRHVKELLPAKAERRAIREEVAKKLAALREFQGRRFSQICGVGGTIRGCCRLYNVRGELPEDNARFPAGAVKALLRPYKEPEKEACDLLIRVLPDRVHTQLPGMLAFQTILETYGAEQVIVSSCGVREGYLLERVLRAFQEK